MNSFFIENEEIDLLEMQSDLNDIHENDYHKTISNCWATCSNTCSGSCGGQCGGSCGGSCGANCSGSCTTSCYGGLLIG